MKMILLSFIILTANEDVQKAVQHKGLEVTKINAGTSEQDEGSFCSLTDYFLKPSSLSLFHL